MLLNLLLNVILSVSTAEPIKVAVIDAGYKQSAGLPLCKEGHYDYITNKQDVDEDDSGEHGTNIASTIYKYTKDKVNICFIFLRVWSFSHDKMRDFYINQAFLRAAQFKVAAINYSMSGSSRLNLEEDALKIVSQNNIPIFNSSGNDRQSLFKNCNQYPACYKNIPLLFPIQNLDRTATKKDFVTFPFCSSHKARDKSRYTCGTSTSAAYATAFYLRIMYAKIQHE